MLPFDNNMMLMIAIALVIAAVAYMYRDLEKTKTELNSIKSIFRQAPAAAPSAPVRQAPKQGGAPVSETEVDDEVDTGKDSE